jgi:CBS-domain-containing membrane protein
MILVKLRQLQQAAERAIEAPVPPELDSLGTSIKKQSSWQARAGVPEVSKERRKGSTVKGWMLQHVQVVEASKTMAEVENILLENDVGCIPVVADGTMKLVGMCTRTDILRQHRYYSSLHYHNKVFADSIAARQPIIELRKYLKEG